MRAFRADSTAAAAIWLALAVFVAYGNALNGPFQFDDYNVIVHEATVHGWSAWRDDLGSGIRPLLKLSYTLNWTMDTGVIGFHLTNLLIHLANAWLVYQLSQSFTQQQWQQAKLQTVPLVVALLFAVHPIHTEAVSYISGRSASLMTLFYLAGFLSYIRGRNDSDQILLYVATPLLFLLALATKETAVTFPLALLAWESCCGDRWHSALRQMWPSWAILIVAVLFFIFNDSYFSQMERSAQLNTLQGNLATQLAAFAHLMQQWLLPLRLNIDPDLPLLTHLSAALLPLVIFIATIVAMLLCWRKRPWVSFALGWAILQLILLYLVLPRLDIGNERQLYLAGWPLLLALVIELTLWLDSRLFRLVAAMLLLTFTGLTVLRNHAYSSEISLWEDTALKSPNKARVHNNLGFAYLLAQRHNEARHEFSTALRLDPQLSAAHYNLMRTDDEIQKAGGILRP